MPTKIREIIVEAKNPEFGFTLNLSIDLVQKKALLISNESLDNFFIFPARQITRMDLQKQAAAIDIIIGLMDLYFGKDLSVDMFNGNSLIPEYNKTVPSVPMIDKKTTVITQPAIDSNPTNEPVKNSEGTYTNTCNYCGKPFQTKRPKAFMCGSKECTTAYNREYMKKRREGKTS